MFKFLLLAVVSMSYSDYWIWILLLYFGAKQADEHMRRTRGW